MKISIIAAMDERRAIGSSGKIPWHLPADFKRFKELTIGHPVIMGRKTFESIGKTLPGRMNIVITANAGFAPSGAAVVHSFEDALAAAGEASEVFVIGGEQIYKLAIPKAETIYLTEVHGAFDGDAFFPDIDEKEWVLADSEFKEKDEKNQIDSTYLTYKRKTVE